MELKKSESLAGRLISDYGSGLLRLALHYLHTLPDAEDAVQEVLLKRMLARRGFPDQEAEKAWMIRVMINYCKDQLKAARRTDLPLSEDLTAGMATMPAAMPDTDVWEAVRALPERYRAVVYLHYYEGYTLNEIARIMKRSANTVQTWHQRAKERMRRFFDET